MNIQSPNALQPLDWNSGVLSAQSHEDESLSNVPQWKSLYQILLQAISQYTPSSSSMLYALLYTKKKSFQVRPIPLFQIDSNLAVIQKLTRQVVQKTLQAAPEKEKESITSLIQSFEELQLLSIRNMLPYIDRYLECIEEERAHGNILKLSSLFSEIRQCIEWQKKLYAVDPEKNILKLEGENTHSRWFREKVNECIRIRNNIEIQFPNIPLPILTHDVSLARKELELPLCHVSQFLDYGATQRVIEAQKDQEEVWTRFRFASKEAYFDSVCEALSQYRSIHQVPELILHALRQSRYIDIGRLLSLSLFRQSLHECFQEISQCHDLQKLKIGRFCSKATLDTYFVKCITEHIKTLLELDLSQSNICDEHFISLPQSLCKIVNLCRTRITGECLKEPFFRTATTLFLSSCRNLRDEYVQDMSCDRLETLSLRNTHITGSCFQNLVFQYLKSLYLSCCRFVTDDHLKRLSSKFLERLSVRSTRITGPFCNATWYRPMLHIDTDNCPQFRDR